MPGRSNHLWWGTAIEAPDPRALATFYSTLLDWTVAHEDDDGVIVKPPQDSVYMVFQLTEDYVPPVWPPVPGEQRTMMHLDFEVEDLDAAVGVAVGLGARLADSQPQDSVRVLLDPAGHPFCLCLDNEA